MGERVGASIQFGGKLRKEFVPELIELIKANDLKVDFDGEGPNEDNLGARWGDWAINYGNLDDLEQFAVDHGLDYEYWVEGGWDWDTYTTRRVDGERFEITHTEMGPALTRKEIEKLGTMAAVLNYFHRFETPLKPLEIVP